MKTTRSEELHRLAQGPLVGGVNSPVRSFRRVKAKPILLASGQGPFVKDVDGNTFVDLVMGYGPHLFGHAHPHIVSKVKNTISKGTAFGFTSEMEILWAQRVLAHLPAAKKIRLMSTGTESCATAVRLARGFTNRNLIAKFSGHYNGHVDSLLVDSGSGLATQTVTGPGSAQADSAGLPQNLIDLSRVIPFNDEKALEKLFNDEGSSLAGIILEPVMGNMGVVPPEPGFLKKIRELCNQKGVVLIFDEVMTGFRVSKKSAQGLFGIEPDLTCLAKIVGGGFPLAALCGKAEIMDCLAPTGKVYQAGTFSGNPVCVSGGLAMLDLIEEQDPYTKLDSLGSWLEGCANSLAEKYKIPFRTERVGSMVSFYFRSGQVRNSEDCKNISNENFNQFFGFLLEEGVLMPPSPFEACFLSVAHDTPQIRTELERAFSNVFQKMGKFKIESA